MPLPSEVFRARLREVRRLKGWTQQDLAEALNGVGVGVNEFVITRIEGGKRRVSLDEAVAIAIVLGVSLLHMIVPLDDGSVQLTPRLTVTTADARVWLRGQRPLRQADERLYYTQTPDSEADWFDFVPGPWRFVNPESFEASRAKWEREFLRQTPFLRGRGHPDDPDAEDIAVSRPAGPPKRDKEDDHR